MKTFKIHTLGCKVNAYESEAMASALIKAGYKEASKYEACDVYIVHTCAVTNTATFKSRQKFAQAKKENPNCIVVAVGCYVQSEAKGVEANENVDILIGSHGKNRIVEVLDTYFEDPHKLNMVDDIRYIKEMEDFQTEEFEHQVRAYLKVQDGCNQFCTYCVIPFSRGRERSLPMGRVKEIATQLIRRGHHEIVLTGIHTGRYGQDFGYTLANLLEELCKLDGLNRIRLSSIEVTEISDELLDVMVKNPKIARHLHIPLQAGDDHTLAEMRRPYKTADYKAMCDKIRKLMPDVCISADCLVGFPSESDEEYINSREFIKECELGFCHVFPFSSRSGTVASKMKPVYHGNEKKMRAKDLVATSNELKKKFYTSYVGKCVDVMIESEKDGKYYGYSSQYIWTEISADKLTIGDIVKVKIKEAKDDVCLGEVM